MKEIVQISGKAKNVFKYVELMKRQNGNVTLGELAKRSGKSKIELG
jgi:hypothetical protein